MNEAEFQRNLTRFKAVLKREKRYLIKNDGEKVTETVLKKRSSFRFLKTMTVPFLIKQKQ